MKCPKCHYIAFDSGDRCKNCGYEFSFSVESSESPEASDAPQATELPIRDGEPMGPLADLRLKPDEAPSRPPARRRTTPGSRRVPRPRSHEASESDLPLFFDDEPAGEAPLVRRSTTPRAPLAVRRATPSRVRTADASAGRHGSRQEQPARIELEPPAVDDPVEIRDAERSPLSVDDGDDLGDSAGAQPETTDLRPRATFGDRLVAGAIDLILILAIDLGVLYFTMRLLTLPFEDLVSLPRVPLFGFLALLNGGYFIAFTAAGGQTIGKMVRQIRVVGRDGRVHLGQSIVRTVGYVLSALPFGLGFVAVALGPDGVALHDRLADTHVVRSRVQ